MSPETGTEEENKVYEESNGFGNWYKVLMYLLIAVYSLVFAGALVFGNYGIAVMFGLAILLFIAVMKIFSTLSFTITADSVSFGFPLLRKRLQLSGITDCAVHEVRFLDYYGYGVQYGRDGTVGYITGSGPAVKIITKSGKRPYVVSVEHPEKVCKIIKESGAVGNNPDKPVLSGGR